jgi:transcriptional regulator with XRE-family HTH domain
MFTSHKISPHKTAWENDDWLIYINNLEILCASHGLRKKDFSRRVGLANAFRTDAGRPSMETIKKISEIFDKSPEWLLTYHDKLTPDVKELKKNYDQHGGWKPRSIEELVGVPEGMGMGRALEMLTRIYLSKNQALIGAIFANLRVFCDRVDQENEIVALKREKAELRELIKSHAKTHSYYGEERRSGFDRRQADAGAPNGVERRSGIERRKQELPNGNN